MKFAKIVQLCKKTKRVEIFREIDEERGGCIQTLRTGGGIYPLTGFPPLDEASFLRMIDVPDAEEEKWTVAFHDASASFDLSDSGDDRPMKRIPTIVGDEGRVMIPYLSSFGEVRYVRAAVLAPFEDSNFDLFERMPGRMIVVKSGLFCLGGAYSEPLTEIGHNAVRQIASLVEYGYSED